MWVTHGVILYHSRTTDTDRIRIVFNGYGLELGRYRFCKSVSVFGFLVGFFKRRYRYRFFKISRYRFRFSVIPHEPTIAYRITPSLTPYALPFPPNVVWALEFALQIAAISDSDIVTIDNLQEHTITLSNGTIVDPLRPPPFSQNGEWGPKNLHCDLRPNSNS